jgi:polyhydroxyalkanoate synthase
MFTNKNDKYQNYFDEYSDFANKNDLGNKYLTESSKIIPCDKYRILVYKQSSDTKIRKKTFLIIPSLFNSPEIFFLNKDKHFIDNLREMGDVFLLDWAEIQDSPYSLNQYIKKIIIAIEQISAELNSEINLIGHCIGGILALLAATQRQNSIKTLTLLTTPWDFSHFNIIITMYKMLDLDNYIKSLDMVPKLYIQILFFLLFPDYFSVKVDKYSKCKTFEEKELFFRIEQWLMSGNSLPKTTYYEIMEDIATKNILNSMKWEMNNKIIAPSSFTKPVYQLIARDDKIVPLTTILSLHKALKQSTIFEVESGHIGYLISSKINIFFKSYKSWLGGL